MRRRDAGGEVVRGRSSGVEELSSKAITGPRRWRSNSRKKHRLRPARCCRKEQIVQSQTMPPWTDGNSRDNRNLVPPPLTVTMDGSLSLRSHVRTTLGISRKPDSSAKTMWAPNRAAFFLCAASPLVSNVRSRLHRAPAHAAPFLRSPSHAVHQAPIWSGW